jgi:hypothetical protein
MVVLIARNNTLNNDVMTSVTIQISSNETYNALLHKMSGVKSSILETTFTSKDTTLAMYYSEENTEFIKDCSESLFFKRYAEKIKETDKFNYCNNKCVPLTFDSLMEVIDHNTPKCTDPIEKDEYCINGPKGMGVTSELKSTCMKQCRNKGSTIETTEYKKRPYFPIGKDMNALK